MQNPLRFIAVHPSLITALVAALAAAVCTPAALGSESVVVTGARIPAPLERFDGAATVITAREIRLHQHRSLGDALASVPGLHVSSLGGAGAQTSVFIRGAESNHVLVLIDGVEASDPGSGLFAFEHLQLNDVERIEVLRGPYGAQYGSESIGGVINVVTRRGRGAPRASARIEAGSLESNAAAVNLSGRSERVDFSLGGAWLEIGGESFTPRRLRAGGDEERDGYGNLDVKGAFGVEFDGRSRADLSFGYTDANTEYDGFSPPFEQSGLEDSTRERRYSARWSGAAGAWRPLLRAGRYQRDYATSGGYSTRAERTQFEWRNDFSWSQRLQFTAGAETELEEFNQYSARTDAVYLQARYAPSDALSLSAAWRNDDPDDFGSDRNWRVAATYVMGSAQESPTESGATRWRAAYGTAFKAPTLFDRFDPNYGNPDLDSETARSWEAGVEQTFALGPGIGSDISPEFRWGATYFNNQIRNLIESDPLTFLPANVASARIEGVESFLSFRPAADVSLRLDYTWMRARDGDRRRLLRRPLRKASLQAGWERASAWSFAATLDYVGPRRDVTRDTFARTTARTTQGGYVLAHFAARRRLGEDLTFFAKADNLFDRDYEPVEGYAGAGAALRVGLETRF